MACWWSHIFWWMVVNKVVLFFTAHVSQERVFVNDPEQVLLIPILIIMLKLVDLGFFQWKVQIK